MGMINRACPLCGSVDDSQVFAEANFDFSSLDKFAFASRKIPEYMHYRMISCCTCDLLYASPLPAADLLVKSYVEADFDSSFEAHCAARTYAGFLPHIMKRLPDLRGTLDIGTGDGAFLEELLKKGFVGVEGIEPSKAPVATAKETIRPLIREGIFRPEDYGDDRFSLVTCFQTLEHLSDPLAMCRKAHAMLKKGGAVYFVCHSRRSLLARVLGLKSPIFDIEHLQLFSPQSAQYLLVQCGFIDIEVKPMVNSYPLSYWLKLFPFPVKLKTAILTRLVNSRIGSLMIPFPVGNLAVIGFKSRA